MLFCNLKMELKNTLFVSVIFIIINTAECLAYGDDKRWNWIGVFIALYLAIIGLCMLVFHVPVKKYYKMRSIANRIITNPGSTIAPYATLAVNDSVFFPPYWSNCDESFKIIDITNEEVADSIRDMVTFLWNLEQSRVGFGKDSNKSKIDHNVLKITKVERIQNRKLYLKYDAKRRKMILKLFKLKEKGFKPLKDVLYEKGMDPSKTHGNQVGFEDQKSGFATTDVIEMKDSNSQLTVDIRHEINEHYLFHGTSTPDNVVSIATSGLSPFYSRAGFQMYGKGVYFAENPIKSDQYTDSKPLTHKNKKLFLVRVCLGELYITSETLDIDKPVCRQHGAVCKNKLHKTVDSTVAARNGGFRECVVYRDFRCYPEYVITYDRRKADNKRWRNVLE